MGVGQRGVVSDKWEGEVGRYVGNWQRNGLATNQPTNRVCVCARACVYMCTHVFLYVCVTFTPWNIPSTEVGHLYYTL